MRCSSRLLGYSYQRPVKHHRSDVRSLHAGRTCVSTCVAPIWAVCDAAAMVARCAWTASWPSLSARVRKRKLASDTGAPTQELVHSKNDDMEGEFWRLKSMDALTVSVGFFAVTDVRPASERQADYCGQSEAPEHDS